jgi:hypothetical protein
VPSPGLVECAHLVGLVEIVEHGAVPDTRLGERHFEAINHLKALDGVDMTFSRPTPLGLRLGLGRWTVVGHDKYDLVILAHTVSIERAAQKCHVKIHPDTLSTFERSFALVTVTAPWRSLRLTNRPGAANAPARGAV